VSSAPPPGSENRFQKSSAPTKGIARSALVFACLRVPGHLDRVGVSPAQHAGRNTVSERGSEIPVFVRIPIMPATDQFLATSVLDQSLQRLPVHPKLEDIGSGVVTSNVTGDLRGIDGFERALRCQDRLTSNWASDHLPTGVDDAAVTRVVNRGELPVPLRQILLPLHSRRSNHVRPGLRGKGP
jgi:hypothetical protein